MLLRKHTRNQFRQLLRLVATMVIGVSTLSAQQTDAAKPGTAAPPAQQPTAQKQSTQTAATGGVQDNSTVRDLPSNGRDWTQAATLQAGVSSVKTQQDASDSNSGRGQRGFGAQISVSGGRPQQNSYILNGISICDYANSAPGSVLGLDLGADAVEQFSVMTSNYPADFGRSSGGIINAVTHAGKEHFHGSVYEYLRNSVFDAKNYFDGQLIPPFTRNQFGGAVSGPLAKHRRAFFFFNYEGLRQSLGVTRIDIVPSAAARSGQLSAGTVAVDPQAARYLNFFPMPNRGVTGNGDTGSYAFSGQQVTPENYLTARADIVLRKQDVLTTSYVFDRAQTTQPDSYDVRIDEIRTQRNVMALQETHTFSPKVINSLRLGVNRVVAEIGLTPEALQPIAADTSYGFLSGKSVGNINIVGLSNFGGGLGSASPYRFHWTSLQGYDDVTITHGVQNFRLGAAVERMLDNMFATTNPNGAFTFNSLQDFLTNRPYSLAVTIPGSSSPRDLRQTLFALYAQDDVRFTPRLIVNLGLRYETVTTPGETRDKLSALQTPSATSPHLGNPYFANPTHLNFEPRLGLAYDVTGNGHFLFKAGSGIFDVLPLLYEFELISQNVAPFLINPTPSNLPAGSFPGPAVQLALQATSLHYVYIEQKPKRNYVAQWNVSLGWQPTPSSSLTAAYVGSRGIHQPFRADDANLVVPVRTAAGYAWPTSVGSGTRINPAAGRIDYLAWQADSNYHALQTQFRATLATLQLQTSYTWSKSLDTNSSTIAGDQFSNSVSNLPWYDHSLAYGPSDFSVGQTLSIHATYPFPFVKNAGWYARGWRAVANFTASAGSPFTPILGGDPLGSRSLEPYDVPNRISGGGCNVPTNHHNPAAYLKTQCFAFPNPVNVLGNLRRNSVLGPGLQTLDLSFFKDTSLKRIRDSMQLQLRGEIFNVFNHPNFAPPLEHRALFNAQGADLSGAGQIVSTATPSRQIQLGIKVIW
jgi:outer membrane receptor protein involved in Fe transport